jgi:ribosomal protein L11
VLGFTPTLGQSGVATMDVHKKKNKKTKERKM